MSKFHLSRLREAAVRADEDDERQVTVKRARIARQLISPWTSRPPAKPRQARRAVFRDAWEEDDWYLVARAR